ncbi:hypothetical protein AB834_01785 [PVC group bacterium (ex Bugula neritina AB1)]|nr:hypothetical protein AB834_01785 [PVC group bacterium (ex Bugula neritina AB1)]
MLLGPYKKGFTLIEMITVMFIFLVLLYIVHGFYGQSTRLIQKKKGSYSSYEQQVWLYQKFSEDLGSSFLNKDTEDLKCSLEVSSEKSVSFLIKVPLDINEHHPMDDGLYFVKYFLNNEGHIERELTPLNFSVTQSDRDSYSYLKSANLTSSVEDEAKVVRFNVRFNEAPDNRREEAKKNAEFWSISLYVDYFDGEETHHYLHKFKDPYL